MSVSDAVRRASATAVAGVRSTVDFPKPLLRHCPTCNAKPGQKCYRWAAERHTGSTAFQGEGHWHVMKTLHKERRKRPSE